MEIEIKTNGITLMPCPFCGGTAELCCHDATGVAWVRCMSCGVTSNGGRASQAIEEWNTRTERTCRIDKRRCSECDAYIHTDAVLAWEDIGGSVMVVTKPVKHCPNCGAKVVEHD